MKKSTLTAKQQRFVAEYLVCLNATKAAIAAGYSRKTAYSQGQRLLKNVEISQAIATKTEKHIAKLDKNSFDTVTRLVELATIDQKETKGNIHGQVKACEVIAEIRQEVVKLHGDVTERLRGKSPAELRFIAINRRDPSAAELAEFIQQGGNA